MKLITYYGKARNFNSIGSVKERENSDRNFYFFNLCSVAFTMIVFFTLGMVPQSISGHNYGKTAFFLSGTLGWNGLNTFQRKITTTKHGWFFYENRQEQLMWQKITMSSWNKTFKQVLSFLSNLTSTLFILRIALTSHLPEIRSKLRTVFWEISQNSKENTCPWDYFLINLQVEACNFLKKETLSQVFSCEFREISKNTFFTEHLRWLLLN